MKIEKIVGLNHMLVEIWECVLNIDPCITDKITVEGIVLKAREAHMPQWHVGHISWLSFG